MRIIELKCENIKNLKAIEIHPGSDAVIISGKNGAGKSAILDSIFMGVTGKSIEEPIRNGEKRAEINIDLGEYKVRRIYTAKGERLEVTSKDGASFKSPQTMLNEILGNISFDPLKFAEMGRNAEGVRKQRSMLAALVGLDFTETDKNREVLYSERTTWNRKIKGGDPTSYRPTPNAPLPLEALVGGMEQPKPGTPRQEISMAEAMNRLSELEQKAEAYKMAADLNAENRRICDEQNQKTKNEKDALLKEVERLEAEFNAKQAELTTLNEILPVEPAITPLPEAIPDNAIMKARNDVVMVEDDNKAIRAAIKYDQAMAQLEDAKKEVAHIEDAMMKIDREKEAKIRAAKYPIEGLGLTDDCVTYEGKPFSQLSTGEQIRVSTAVAMALNPTLKVIIVREGSLLDKAGLNAIVDMAKDKDYQLWCEVVADAKHCGIYIENGEIKG